MKKLSSAKATKQVRSLAKKTDAKSISSKLAGKGSKITKTKS